MIPMTSDSLKNQIASFGFEIEGAKKDQIILQEKLTEVKELIVVIDESIDVLSKVLAMTQQGVAQFIEETVAMALQYVVGEDYGFSMIFELKRSQPEVLFYITKKGVHYSPKFSVGIGIVDISSFALRLVCYALMSENTSPVLIFDEPFRHLSGVDENERVGLMVKKLSELLGVQIIIVTGKEQLIQYVDKSFEVKIIDGISNVEEKNICFSP